MYKKQIKDVLQGAYKYAIECHIVGSFAYEKLTLGLVFEQRISFAGDRA